jgi:hypothetical protein
VRLRFYILHIYIELLINTNYTLVVVIKEKRWIQSETVFYVVPIDYLDSS